MSHAASKLGWPRRRSAASVATSTGLGWVAAENTETDVSRETSATPDVAGKHGVMGDQGENVSRGNDEAAQVLERRRTADAASDVSRETTVPGTHESAQDGDLIVESVGVPESSDAEHTADKGDLSAPPEDPPAPSPSRYSATGVSRETPTPIDERASAPDSRGIVVVANQERVNLAEPVPAEAPDAAPVSGAVPADLMAKTAVTTTIDEPGAVEASASGDDESAVDTDPGKSASATGAGSQEVLAPAARAVVPADATSAPAALPASGATDPAGGRTEDRFRAPESTRIFTVSNQKGGVGKTTTTVNLAVALAQGGLRVLVIDLDPQGNASTGLGIEHPSGTPSSYQVVVDGLPLAEAAQPVTTPGVPPGRVWCVPATSDLAGAEVELAGVVVGREFRLRDAIRKYLEASAEPIDFIFIDCPPSLGLLTVNALAAALEVLIPVQCEYYALEGLGQLLETVELVHGYLNPRLTVSTMLLTMFDARTKLAGQVVDEVRAHFGDTVLHTVIPRSVKVSEAPSYGMSVMTYDPESRGAVCYAAAARELSERDAPRFT